VFGAQKYGPYDGILRLVFSPDGKRVAFWAEKDKKHFVVVDGEPLPLTMSHEEAMFLGFGVDPKLVFSPDGKRVAYPVARGTLEKGFKMFIAVDREAHSKQYDGVKAPAYSADGQGLGFIARAEGKWRVVLGATEGEGYEDVQSLSYGKVPVYVASPGATSFVVVGERKLEKYSPAGPPVPSPTAAIAAYWADLKDGKYAVVVDEEAGEGFALMNPIGQAMGYEKPRFLADGKTVVYGVTLATGESHVVIGRQKSEPYDLIDDLVLSLDGKSVAYVAAKDEKYFVVAAGKKSAGFERAAQPVFAADGKSVGFYAVKDVEIWWKVLE
jgi:hypothetical protein